MASLRNLLSGKVRSQSGCYTCRLRRKKCDENRPQCEACQVLEITCHFGDDKPEWMDGGAKQKAMAETIKAQVKKQASQRRDRKYIDMLEKGTKMVTLDDPSDKRPSVAKVNGISPGTQNGHKTFELSPGSSTATGTTGPSPEAPWHSQLFGASPGNASGKSGMEGDYDAGQDTHLIMVYLDFVFPYLFPHYRPPLLVGGRGWVLDVLLHGTRSIFYTAISLSSYFFGVMLANGESNHEECTNRMVHQLQRQMERGLKELQKDIMEINAKKPNFNIREGLKVMQSVLQMLIFEVSTNNNDNWRMHLDAAVALFMQILPDPHNWTENLHTLWTPRWPPPEMGIRRPWSTDQASIRFFGVNLLYLDVMASITMSTEPRLRSYQPCVIPSTPPDRWSLDPQAAKPLRTEEFFGMYNWVLQLLGDIAALDAYKKQQRKDGSLSMGDLMARGQPISETITLNLDLLESQASGMDMITKNLSLIQDPLLSLNPLSACAPNFVIHNLIWVHAAKIYFNVVLSGWQPSNPEIRTSVDRLTQLLFDLPHGKTMQTLAWPFCVGGCLAPAEYEGQYREMVSRLGPLQVFGTIREALAINEMVWASRGQLDETWDIAKCLNVLGHSVLLM
ncbi:hypothetical protein VHEMI05064 [[Torrubiella] hemipterigena]|uniref:Zn(2)-C6 fungal-type domain-containing protein n=1 Tax=[Torrubiella] hemipterigena TaxID=1531966 RepID=A0A0A1THV9_9HYPO|nr:hypothetical protein VHEMI05064 [[Torrubiella] hemipterigena]